MDRPVREASMRAPTLFISHGSPMLAIEPSPAREFLSEFGKNLAKPDAIVIASAHFETEIPAVVTDAKPDMIYDFGGFPDALYQIVYPAPGQPDVAMKVAHLVHDAGFQTGVISHRGFDHGTWVPLSLMFPDADIPVVQLAIQPHLGTAHHVALGRALTSLKEQNVLVIGSGSATHNLREFYAHRHMKAGEAPEWVMQFDDWVRARVTEGDTEKLINTGRSRRTPCATIRPRSISCRCMSRSVRQARGRKANSSIRATPTACFRWTHTSSTNLCMRA